MVGFCLGISDAALMAYNFEMGGRTNRFTSLGSPGLAVRGINRHLYPELPQPVPPQFGIVRLRFCHHLVAEEAGNTVNSSGRL